MDGAHARPAPLAVAAVATLLATTPAFVAIQDRAPRDGTPPVVGQDGKDVEWVPTPDALIDTMLTMAAVTADDVVVDLGSGDGRTVIAAAARGARAVGVEYDGDLVRLSRARAATAGVGDRAAFVEADLFDFDLSEATVITMFLLPDLNLRLRPTLLALRPGTRIVSNTWDLGEWRPDRTIQLDPCPGFCTALLWTVPARVEGRWRGGGAEWAFAQRFQTVSGTVRGPDRAVTAIEDGRLDGATVTFRAAAARYRGLVDGDTIRGRVTTAGHPEPWVAARVSPVP